VNKLPEIKTASCSTFFVVSLRS